MGEVRYEVVREIAWVTLDRPEARNALDRAMRDGLFSAFDRFAADSSARVLVLTGTGPVFCAGMDLKELASSRLANPGPDFLPQLGRNVVLAKPVIAAVNGPALAGGFLLAQNCDLVVAADTATFGITEVKIGRGAPWAAPLPWLIPPRVAMELLLTGDPITAQRAFEVGLVNEVVPADSLVASAQSLAERIAANAPLSVAAGKRTVALVARRSLDEALVEAERIWDHVYRSEDAQEGPAAFASKRPPRWHAR